MPLEEDDLRFAPTRIRRVWEIVANPQLDAFRVPISTQLKGIDIEMFATEPANKHVPLLVCISNCILRDIHINREKVTETEWETRLYFSVGISWDSGVWKWGEHYVFMECFAKFSQSQGEMFDDNPADVPIATPEAERLRTAEVEDLAKQLGTNVPALSGSPGIDPLRADAEAKTRRGRPRKNALPFESGGKGHATRPNA